MPKWLVGIPTFKRTEMLADALLSLTRQIDAPSFVVAVVDNDPAGSAEAVVRQYEHQLNLQYRRELRPGVVHVRNEILDLATNYEYLVFLDDDQVVSQSWLAEMNRACQRYPGSIIKGPVRYDLGFLPREGSLQELAFRMPIREEGAKLESTGTGNTTIPICTLPYGALGHRFDPRYSSSGGEDTKYFLELTSIGIGIRWWPGAEVVEQVPGERSALPAVKRRFKRSGQVGAIRQLESRARGLVGLGYLARFVIGTATSLIAVRGLRRTRGRILMLSGLGGLSLLLGRGEEFYGAHSGQGVGSDPLGPASRSANEEFLSPD